MKWRILMAAALAVAASSQAQADEQRLALQIRAVQHLALNPVLIRAVRSQNAEQLGEQTIAERDRAWQATTDLAGIKWSLQESSAGQLLRQVVEANPMLNGAYLTDRRGANVAAYPAPDDYYQGDEAEWREAYNGGRGRVRVGDPQLSEGSATRSQPVSAPLIYRGETIGVLVVSVAADAAG